MAISFFFFFLFFHGGGGGGWIGQGMGCCFFWGGGAFSYVYSPEQVESGLETVQ